MPVGLRLCSKTNAAIVALDQQPTAYGQITNYVRSSIMISRYGRYLLLPILLLLATPLIAGLAMPESAQEILQERRTPAPAPSVPHSWDDLAALPKEVDDYLQDRFGLRKQMIRWYSNLTKRLLAEGDHRYSLAATAECFYLWDDAVRQSAGLVRRDARVAESADFLVAMRDALRQRGIRFLVASPPNAATIYQDDLPGWARSQGRTTEYDLFIADLAARGIKAVDLRPILWAARTKGPAYFLHDTHWTARAAIAGFNAIAEAEGHREWRIDADAALTPVIQRQGGDLARMIGVENDVAEPIPRTGFPPCVKGRTDGAAVPQVMSQRQTSRAKRS